MSVVEDLQFVITHHRKLGRKKTKLKKNNQDILDRESLLVFPVFFSSSEVPCFTALDSNSFDVILGKKKPTKKLYTHIFKNMRRLSSCCTVYSTPMSTSTNVNKNSFSSSDLSHEALVGPPDNPWDF